MNKNAHAFNTTGGLTTREYVAIQIASGIAAKAAFWEAEDIAKRSVEIADVLIKELNKENE